MRDSALADLLERNSAELARRVADAHLQQHPEFAERWGPIGRVRCIEDAEFHIRYLAQAIRHDAPALFAAYVTWAREMLAARRIPWEDLRRNLEILRDELLRDATEAEASEIRVVIDAALDAPEQQTESFIVAGAQSALARAYLTALLRADRRTAASMIDAAVKNGLTIRQLYLDVIQPVQREIGRLWQTNQISVAEEHYCTASTQAVMAQFYPQILATPRIGRKIVVAAVGSELHEIGVRMVADFFELAGWDSIYLGANTPAQSLVDLVCRERPQLVALGVTMTYNMSSLRELITKLRGDQRCTNVKIIVGGFVFRVREDLWRSIGADGYATDADAAVRIGGQLVGE